MFFFFLIIPLMSDIQKIQQKKDGQTEKVIIGNHR